MFLLPFPTCSNLFIINVSFFLHLNDKCIENSKVLVEGHKMILSVKLIIIVFCQKYYGY